jgi:hypothetical protein
MKPIKIEIKNLYAGYKVGGLTLDEAMYLSDEDRLEKMITFILSRSEILIDELKQREANNNSGTMSAAATSTYRNVLIIKKNAQRVKNTMEPMAFFELGKSMEGIKTSLALMEGFVARKRHTKGASKGANQSAEIRAKEKRELQIEIKELWIKHKKSKKDDAHAINLIASSINRTTTNVRTHLDELDLRKIKHHEK